MSTARDHIIESTCQLLELQGYHATGLNQIIKESGSPKGSLYYYFPGGKEDLAIEALRRVGDQVLGRIRANLAQAGASAAVIAEFIRLIAVNMEASGFRAGGPITALAMETASTHERLRQECERIYGEWQGAFAERLVVGGMDEGRAVRLAVFIIAAIEGGVILCRTQRSRAPLEAVADEIGFLIGAVG
jgi:TetR/AcrR family transcriptional repressor of lmrAB and yxaGH operons